jgi:hypothetical protein
MRRPSSAARGVPLTLSFGVGRNTKPPEGQIEALLKQMVKLLRVWDELFCGSRQMLGVMLPGIRDGPHEIIGFTSLM